MIRLSVYYPKSDSGTFDHDYYKASHVPLCLDAWGLDASAAQIDKGLDGPYEAAVHFTFDSMEALGAAMQSEKMPAVMADLPNYTTLQPVMQTSEIVG